MATKKTEPAAPTVPPNRRAAPMEYEVRMMPNLRLERTRLAAEAEDLTKAELVERAADAGLDLDKGDTKTEMIETVRGAVAPIPTEET